MLTSEMISLIREHGFDDLSDFRILGFINTAYHDVCTREPWPFLEQTASPTIDATTGRVTSPTDIGKVLGFEDTAHGRGLEPVRLDEFTRAYGSKLTLAGDPHSYFFVGANVYVYPIPASGSFVLQYLRVPPDLTFSPDTTPILPSQHHEVLVYGALARAYFMEDDPENKLGAIQDFEDAISKMRNDLWTRQFDRTDTIQDLDGMDAVDWLY